MRRQHLSWPDSPSSSSTGNSPLTLALALQRSINLTGHLRAWFTFVHICTSSPGKRTFLFLTLPHLMMVRGVHTKGTLFSGSLPPRAISWTFYDLSNSRTQRWDTSSSPASLILILIFSSLSSLSCSLCRLQLDFWTQPCGLNKSVDVMVPPKTTLRLEKSLRRLNIDKQLIIKDVEKYVWSIHTSCTLHLLLPFAFLFTTTK